MENNLEYTKTFYEDKDKNFQWRITVSTFKDVQYLNIRKYFLTFEEDYQPTKEGMSIPLEVMSVFNLAGGLLDILSHSECETIKEFLKK
jgi:hypothetical protein